MCLIKRLVIVIGIASVINLFPIDDNSTLMTPARPADNFPVVERERQGTQESYQAPELTQSDGRQPDISLHGPLKTKDEVGTDIDLKTSRNGTLAESLTTSYSDPIVPFSQQYVPIQLNNPAAHSQDFPFNNIMSSDNANAGGTTPTEHSIKKYNASESENNQIHHVQEGLVTDTGASHIVVPSNSSKRDNNNSSTLSNHDQLNNSSVPVLTDVIPQDTHSDHTLVQPKSHLQSTDNPALPEDPSDSEEEEEFTHSPIDQEINASSSVFENNEAKPSPINQTGEVISTSSLETHEPDHHTLPASEEHSPTSSPVNKNSVLNQDTSDEQDSDEEIRGIDTVNLEEPRGNWLFKRIWWERAESKFEKIRHTINILLEERMAFFAKRTEIDKNILDPFYETIGMREGELSVIIAEYLKALERDTKEKGLHASQKNLLSLIKQEKKTLENIEASIEAVINLDEDIDESLNQLAKQVNKVRGYEQDAWVSFKEIARVLSDKTARELYYGMNDSWQNIKNIRKYIGDEFKAHFEEVINVLKAKIEFIQTSLHALHDKGIDLTNPFEHLFEQCGYEDNSSDDNAVREDNNSDGSQEEVTVENRGIIGSIIGSFSHAITWFFKSIVGIIKWPFTLFSSSTPNENEQTIENEQEINEEEDGDESQNAPDNRLTGTPDDNEK